MTDLLREIDDEIRGGLRNEAARLDDALFNLEFYRGNFSRFPPRDSSSRYAASSAQRTSPVMRRVVQSITANLYGHGPMRALKAPDGGDTAAYKAASEWLDAVYRANSADAYWQEADRMGAVGDFAAFQARGTTDPKKPVRIYLWRANELVVWVHPEDQLVPAAVGTIDIVDNQRRLKLWTAETIRTYVTDKWNPMFPNGGTAYREVETKDNPYAILPFSFVHFEFPTCDFHTDGPGTSLRELNDCINHSHTELGDGVRFNLAPLLVGKNVRAGFQIPSPIRPGDYIDLPARGDGMEGDPKQELDYLQADSSFVAAGWDDVQSFLDHSLSMHGVPPSTIRLVQDSARSGVSIVAEQIPLILWAQGRQRPFAHYEDALARLVLTVGAKHLDAQDFDVYRATAGQLAVVAEEPGLVLRYPSMYPKLPGEERDRGDQWALDNKLRSRTQLLMERESLTREEAEQQLEETAKDLEREQKLFGSLTPPELRPGPGRAAAEVDLDEFTEDAAENNRAIDETEGDTDE